MRIVYSVYLPTKQCLSAGPVPEVWGSISGMQDLSYEDLADLSWAGYTDYAFLTREAALAIGVNAAELDAADEVYRRLQVPQKITARQARLGLLQLGMLDDMETYIASIQDSNAKRAAEIEWEYATEFLRTNFLLNQAAQQWNWTPQQLDNLFTTSSAL